MHYLLLVCAVFILNACQAKTNSPDMNTQRTGIIEAVEKNQLSVVEAELKKGVDVNTTDKQKKSLLLIATQANNLEMAKLLVAHGANVNQQDQIHDSPFLYAGAAGLTDLVKLFLEHGARFDLFNRYNGTALIPACERGHIEVVKILANTKGFPIDHVNRLGWTALMEAVVLGNGSAKYVTVVQLLVDAGCNIQIPDHDGVTALQHARSRGYTDIVAVLEKAAAKMINKK
ncbi:ankyrin repeat domain-containing protein [Niabella sp.]|uniref:ankyrin repeat domain-containing protein n=1 Tax=Niabella sp. TaxID=1962976 RepID=UPI002630377A|nr:ankyrin repeat domain-containing protein [Niabella sp.]